MTSVHIYSSENFKEAENTSEDMTLFYHLLYKLHDATNAFSKAQDVDSLYKIAIESAKHILDIDRIGILLVDSRHKTFTGSWGCDEQGHIRPEHEYSAPVSQEFKDVISKIENKGSVCTWDNHPLYKFDEHTNDTVVIGLGWSANIAIWQEDTLIGWVACDNLIKHRTFRPYHSHILRLFSQSLSDCRDRLLAHEKIIELNKDLEFKVKQRTRQLGQVQRALELSNGDLEQRISARTQSLKLKNEQLEIAVKKLSSTENQLSIVKAHGAMKDLVVGIAHELKHPLKIANKQTKILPGLLNEISDYIASNNQEKVTEVLQQGKELSETLQSSITDMHSLGNEFERLSSIKIDSIPAEEVVLSEWLDHMLLMTSRLEPNINNLNIEIKFNTQLKSVILHSEVLIQIFKELLLNAYLHAEQGKKGKVLINLNIVSGSLYATIEDNGPGIDPTLQEKVFNPFITTSEETGHKGLGLNVAFNLVYFLLKGNLSYFESKLGGAGFLVKCPIQLGSKSLQEQEDKLKHPFAIQRDWETT